MAKWFNKLVVALLVVIAFLAWTDGRGSATDFAGGVGRVTGDVVSAVIEFFDGLAESKPSADASATEAGDPSATEAGDPSTAVLGERISRRGPAGLPSSR
jgi:hypothetical protein